MPPIDPRRVARLEEAVKALHQQVNVLISEVRTLAVQAEAEAAAGAQGAVPTPIDESMLAPRAPMPPLAPPAPPPVPGGPLPPPPPPRVREPMATPAAPRPWAAPLGGGREQPPVAPTAAPSGAPRGVAPMRPTGGSGGGGGRVPPPPPPPRGPQPNELFEFGRAGGMSLETLIGRYGMIGGAVLLLLMGIGTFISWAIANNVITPVGRVALGALAAGGFVAAGFYFRKKDEQKFGNVLLSLALAITHTVAWGAGPKLHIIEPKLALGLAALASVALAALALADEDETLYVVGIGGALLAPFVTSSGRSSGPLTLVYGWIVITAGLFAMRGHRWKVATRLMTFAGVLYAGVGLIGATFSVVSDRMAPPFFALACTWSAAILAAAEYRTTLVRSYMTTMAIAMLMAAASVATQHPADVAPLALAGTVSIYLIQRPLSMRAESWLLDAFAIPLALLGAALIANGGIDAPNGVTITLIWGAAAAGAALMNDQDRRGPHYLVFGLTTLVSVGYLLRHDPLALGLGLVAHAVAMIFLMRKEKVQLVAVPIVVGLIVALVKARDILAVRPSYVSDPFINSGAILLLLTLLAWWRFFDVLATTKFDEHEPEAAWAVLARAFLPIALFLWGWYELGSTISHDVATSLVTLYFAICGVGAIHYGRSREVPVVRHTGLGLCIVAALYALSRVWNLESVGIKAGTLILVSLFLIAVHYWYRRAED